MAEASSAGRSREAAGLRKALVANQAGCSDALLNEERDAGIRNAKRKVAEREKSLNEAERKGDQKKIAARKAKLEEARRDLSDAETPIGQ